MKSLTQIARELQEATGNSKYELFPINIIRMASSPARAIEYLEVYREYINHALGWLRAEIRNGNIKRKKRRA